MTSNVENCVVVLHIDLGKSLCFAELVLDCIVAEKLLGLIVFGEGLCCFH